MDIPLEDFFHEEYAFFIGYLRKLFLFTTEVILTPYDAPGTYGIPCEELGPLLLKACNILRKLCSSSR